MSAGGMAMLLLVTAFLSDGARFRVTNQALAE